MPAKVQIVSAERLLIGFCNYHPFLSVYDNREIDRFLSWFGFLLMGTDHLVKNPSTKYYFFSQMSKIVSRSVKIVFRAIRTVCDDTIS